MFEQLRARTILAPMVIALLAVLVGTTSVGSAAAALPPVPSRLAASFAAVSVSSSPTELRIQWSSNMIGGNANDRTKYSSVDPALLGSLAGMTPVLGPGGPGLSADGLVVTFRYGRPLVPGTYTLRIADIQDGGLNDLTPNPTITTVTLAAPGKLLALIAEPNNPFPPASGARPIADGWDLVITGADARFASAPAGGEFWLDTGVRIGLLGGGDWSVELSAPRGQALTPGVYTGAYRSAFRPAGVPGIDVSGFGSGCNTASGSFEIRDIAFVDDPLFGRKPVRLDASFEFLCDAFTSRLLGLVRYSQDTTPPLISATIAPAPNGNGWNNGPVTVSWNVSDPESGIRFGCNQTHISSETSFYFVPCSATNGDGLRSDAFVVVKIDLTLPTIAATRTPAANSFGWNRTPVVVAFTCTDPISIWGFASGLASCSSGATFGEGAGQSITGQTVDRAGNATSLAVGGINIDLTAPTIDASATTVGGAYAAGRWTNQAVTVHYTCADAGSGIVNCGGDQTVDAEGTTPNADGTATDRAGNTASASFGPIEIDTTPPAISVSGNAGAYAVDQTILITCVASDALSGIATTSCPSVASGPATKYVGTTATTTTTLTAAATDNAGNTATASTTFTVTVTADGICRLSASLATADDICTQATSIATAPNAAAKAGKQQAFDNFLAAQSGKSIPADLATVLSHLARLL